MNYHIVLPRVVNLTQIAKDAECHKCPRHSMWLLCQELNATIHEPKDLSTNLYDQINSKLIGSPELWSLARNLASQVNSDDCIFCLAEAGGLQVAAVCGAKPNRPKICMFVHNLDRPRGRLSLKLWRVAERVDLFLVCSQQQFEFLTQYLNLPSSKVKFIWDQTDIKFFTPGLSSPNKPRPLIVSVGLEQRDYRTLAAATGNLNVDVRISGFSQDAAVLAKTFPENIPANMSRRFYSWTELLQLYRDADVVVVSLKENKYAAGVQSLMEAMACQRPVVVTATTGLQHYLQSDVVTCIKPGDIEQMQQAIVHILKYPEKADENAQRGYQLAQERHNIDNFVAEMTHYLKSL
ncbi:glycosyltransferase family 4 protein [Aliinostoc sp. HNIBRCY26]|uniref:glycosyltransferase family 4 protein n=1 Tax=Aliinostoc sp. HNIBRCY26 TaxID=3418997 RepID=UPI003CFD0F01